MRKRGVSYVAISELLTQSGITASDICVMNFCRSILMERRNKPFPARRAKSDASHPAARKATPNATRKTALPATQVAIVNALPVPTERAPVNIHTQHIAKAKMLPPGKQRNVDIDKSYDDLPHHLGQPLKTAVGRLVLYKPFLAAAAVWLDSAARCCGLRLRFCVRETCPALGTK